MGEVAKNIALLVLFAVAIAGSSAQSTYEVLDSLGWTIPPGGAVAYTTWAANKKFTVGDTLGNAPSRIKCIALSILSKGFGRKKRKIKRKSSFLRKNSL